MEEFEAAVKAFDDFHSSLSSEGLYEGNKCDERTYACLWMSKWLPESKSGDGKIQHELNEIDLLLDIYSKGNEDVKKYVDQRGSFDCDMEPNTITCGFFLPRSVGEFGFIVGDKTLKFHNETIPDHFRTILGLGGTNNPFLYVGNAGITSSYFEKLQTRCKEILERCRTIKFRILDSDKRFLNYYQSGKWAKGKQLYDLELLYLLAEANDLDSVGDITNDMKDVYGKTSEIIEGVMRMAISRGNIAL